MINSHVPLWEQAPNFADKGRAEDQVLKGLDSRVRGLSTHYQRTLAFGAEAGCGAGALPPHPQDLPL
jgi:hypothetical protein